MPSDARHNPFLCQPLAPFRRGTPILETRHTPGGETHRSRPPPDGSRRPAQRAGLESRRDFPACGRTRGGGQSRALRLADRVLVEFAAAPHAA